jgi:acetylornithine deacetylase/succinyl-diaminopimelate desuccinylase-like protein
MEFRLYPSQTDNTDFEQHKRECKELIVTFLEDLGLSDDLIMQVLDDVWAHILRNNSFLFLGHSDNQMLPGAGLN